MTQYVDNQVVEKQLTMGQLFLGNRTQALAASTLTLTVADQLMQIFTGSTAAQVVKLPDATTLSKGWKYEFYNQGTVPLSVLDGNNAALVTLAQTSVLLLALVDNSTAAGQWVFIQFFSGVASGIVNYNVVATATFTTTSTSDVLLTTMSVSPTAGTYAVWFTCSWSLSASSAISRFTIYNNGVAVTDSLRNIDSPGGGNTASFASQTVISVAAGTTVDIRARTTAATLTVTNRNMLLIRLGN